MGTKRVFFDIRIGNEDGGSRGLGVGGAERIVPRGVWEGLGAPTQAPGFAGGALRRPVQNAGARARWHTYAYGVCYMRDVWARRVHGGGADAPIRCRVHAKRRMSPSWLLRHALSCPPGVRG